MPLFNKKSPALTRRGRTPKEIGLINNEEERLQLLTEEELKKESLALGEQARGGESLDKLLVKGFALVREASRRTLGQRHFDVQLWGGVVLHQGAIAEMLTGEGKTLAATLPAYLNALSGEGVHIHTVNDYLAKRDAVWMGQIYHFFGLKVACLVHNGAFIYDPEWRLTEEERKKIDEERDVTGSFLIKEEFLRPVPRRDAYLADITYGTNHEFGFDYLRDNLTSSHEAQVQRPLNYAIIDEVDSILIDEARTPLIISVADQDSSNFYKVFASAVKRLVREEDYLVDEKLKSAEITEAGIDKVEEMTGIKNLYAVENLRLAHYLEACLKAQALYERDRDYVVREGEVIIVDQFTGRLMFGRRYSAGLHQAIEAKEGVAVKEESRTFAQITIQNYFRLYKKLAGMTGTAQTSAEEFHKVYNLEVVSIPPNRPMIRENLPDLIYKDLGAKYRMIANEVKERHEKGQPVLVGTVSIEKNEILSQVFRKAGIPHELLNAKNHEQEGAIIAQAGRLGAVTVATNMAGRGVDIILGGNPPDPEEAGKIKELGGLHVLGTERHEARRIDNQLRGRSGRQGDHGSSQFYLSLEDDLLRIFGGDRIKNFMERFDLPEDQPIENKLVTKAISQAQTRVEGFNFDAREHLLEYDDVLNKQRLVFYVRRQKILEAISPALNREIIQPLLEESIEKHITRLEEVHLDEEERIKLFSGVEIIEPEEKLSTSEIKERAGERIKSFEDNLVQAVGRQILGLLDFLWMNHLEDIEALRESVRIRAYGQRDPLVEYRRESRILFDQMQVNFEEWIFSNIFKIAKRFKENAESGGVGTQARVVPAQSVELKNIGRNDPCPCGAINPNTGKVYKYKHCGLINAPHHKR